MVIPWELELNFRAKSRGERSRLRFRSSSANRENKKARGNDWGEIALKMEKGETKGILDRPTALLSTGHGNVSRMKLDDCPELKSTALYRC